MGEKSERQVIDLERGGDGSGRSDRQSSQISRLTHSPRRWNICTDPLRRTARCFALAALRLTSVSRAS